MKVDTAGAKIPKASVKKLLKALKLVRISSVTSAGVSVYLEGTKKEVPNPYMHDEIHRDSMEL